MRACWAGRRGEQHGPRVRVPRFKRKGRSRDALRLTGAIHLHPRAVRLPRIGTVRLWEDASRWTDRIAAGSVRVTAASVRRAADRGLVSLAVEATRRMPTANGHGDTVGVARGLLAPATLSDGTVIAGSTARGRRRRPLRRLARAPSRTQRGSRRRARRLARQPAWVAAVRRDRLHQLPTALATPQGRVVIEDLNVRGMLGNRRLARSLSAAGFAEFRRPLAYQGQWYGCRLVVAERWVRSSNRCAAGGVGTASLPLSQRAFRWDACGFVGARDRNAACTRVGWADHHPIASRAGETPNGRGADRKPGRGPAGGDEAATGTAPEPTGSSGGPQPRVPVVAAGGTGRRTS